MEKTVIESKIKEILEEVFLIDFKAEATPDTNLFDGGFMDSFGMVQLVSRLKEEFSITISAEEAMSGALFSLNSIVNFVIGKKTNK